MLSRRHGGGRSKEPFVGKEASDNSGSEIPKSAFIPQVNTAVGPYGCLFFTSIEKKSQILVKQNLASEEGDEKLIMMTPKSLARFNHLYYLIEQKPTNSLRKNLRILRKLHFSPRESRL